jgi:hypothetical protein
MALAATRFEREARRMKEQLRLQSAHVPDEDDSKITSLAEE